MNMNILNYDLNLMKSYIMNRKEEIIEKIEELYQ